jgi:hypothetical protein
MRRFIFVLAMFFFSFLHAQDIVRDTFSDEVNARKYVVSGYYVPNMGNMALLPSSPTGYYVTQMQMHHDWKYLTNSFAKEALKRAALVNAQDTVKITLLAMLGAKDIQINSLSTKQLLCERMAGERALLLKEESNRFQTLYANSIAANIELTTRLSREKSRKTRWQSLTMGGVLLGFVAGFLLH